MELHVLACSECQHEQKHVTTTPCPMGLSYSSECEQCEKMRTFKFVYVGKRKADWYKNTLVQVKKMKERNRLKESKRRKSDQVIKKIAK